MNVTKEQLERLAQIEAEAKSQATVHALADAVSDLAGIMRTQGESGAAAPVKSSTAKKPARAAGGKS